MFGMVSSIFFLFPFLNYYPIQLAKHKLSPTKGLAGFSFILCRLCPQLNLTVLGSGGFFFFFVRGGVEGELSIVRGNIVNILDILRKYLCKY